MNRKILCLGLLLPTLAVAGVSRDAVGTGRISPASPARYVAFGQWSTATSVASGTVAVYLYPHSAPARLVDVLVYQVGAGTGGAGYTVDVRNAAGTSLLTTLANVTQASGNEKVVDARGELALPSGWTRPVIKTDATPDFTKGQRFFIVTTESGTYSTHATLLVALVFEPKQ